MIKIIKQSFALGVVLALGACVSLLPTSGDLNPRLGLSAGMPSTSKDMTPKYDASLTIADVNSAAVYNSFNVAIATAPYQYEYLSGAEWTDRVPVLVRRFIEQRFENEYIFEAVGDRTELPIATYELQTDIRAFHLDRTNGQEIAKVILSFRLKTAKGRILGSKVFFEETQPTDKTAPARAEALNRSASTVVNRAMEWVDARVAQDRQSTEMR
ncbi:MAG: ABC-type transport auxiliary lipoprotein family protein [Pseudomonadota bacterium]